MNIADSRFNSVDEFSNGLMEKLRTLANHADGLDPEDCLIFDVEHLLQTQIVLVREGLINKVADPEEALRWKAQFLERVSQSEQLNESSELAREILRVFDAYVDVCESV